MANYKHQQQADQINIAGYVRSLKDSDKLVTLIYIDGTLGVPHTINDEITGTDYQVPTGRKLRIFLFETGRALSVGQYLATTTVADSSTGEVTIMTQSQINTWTDDKIIIFDVAQDLYVTFISGTVNFHQITLKCIEMDA